METISINEIKKYIPKWFSVNNIRFFKSRYPEYAYKKDNKAYFVSSEKYLDEPRKYTTRVFDFQTLILNNIGEFQEFNNNNEATRTLMKHLKGE